jgi:hypothetical protein
MAYQGEIPEIGKRTSATLTVGIVNEILGMKWVGNIKRYSWEDLLESYGPNGSEVQFELLQGAPRVKSRGGLGRTSPELDECGFVGVYLPKGTTWEEINDALYWLRIAEPFARPSETEANAMFRENVAALYEERCLRQVGD